MKELKFRAWEKNLKQMIPVDNISFKNKMINTGSAWRLFNEIELMQYTGLNDSNGVEIYDGDIISRIGHIGKVIWFGDGYYVEWFDGKDREFEGFYPYWSELRIVKDGEVIGNIYENTELLSNEN